MQKAKEQLLNDDTIEGAPKAGGKKHIIQPNNRIDEK